MEEENFAGTLHQFDFPLADLREPSLYLAPSVEVEHEIFTLPLIEAPCSATTLFDSPSDVVGNTVSEIIPLPPSDLKICIPVKGALEQPKEEDTSNNSACTPIAKHNDRTASDLSHDLSAEGSGSIDDQLNFILKSAKKGKPKKISEKPKAFKKKINRTRKSTSQIEFLLKEIKPGDVISRQKRIEIAKRTGLKEVQVYKWCWDIKKKTLPISE